MVPASLPLASTPIDLRPSLATRTTPPYVRAACRAYRAGGRAYRMASSASTSPPPPPEPSTAPPDSLQPYRVASSASTSPPPPPEPPTASPPPEPPSAPPDSLQPDVSSAPSPSPAPPRRGDLESYTFYIGSSNT